MRRPCDKMPRKLASRLPCHNRCTLPSWRRLVSKRATCALRSTSARAPCQASKPRALQRRVPNTSPMCSRKSARCVRANVFLAKRTIVSYSLVKPTCARQVGGARAARRPTFQRCQRGVEQPIRHVQLVDAALVGVAVQRGAGTDRAQRFEHSHAFCWSGQCQCNRAPTNARFSKPRLSMSTRSVCGTILSARQKRRASRRARSAKTRTVLGRQRADLGGALLVRLHSRRQTDARCAHSPAGRRRRW